MISAIILAAGMSSRMGFPKQLLKLGNRPLIQIITENVLASSVDEVIVVTGCREKEVSDAIKGLKVQTVFNPRYEQGQGSSLSLGINAINPNATAFLVFMCDQPLISPAMINTVIEAFKERHSLLLRPVYRDIPGHPVIFSSSLIPEIGQLGGDEGARKVLKKLGHKVDYLPVEEDAVIIDMDTPDSYENIKRRCGFLD